MPTQAITSANNLQELAMSYEKNQYTLWQILGIWALAALPVARREQAREASTD